MPRFNRHRRRREASLLFLGRLGLDFIRKEGRTLHIGACTSLTQILASPEVTTHLPLLEAVCRDMASPAVRNAATLGGNVANNARNADGIAALTALDATVVTTSTQGEAKWPITAFVLAPKSETLANGGLITRFEIPCLEKDDKWAWEKLKQRQGEGRSILSVALRARMEGKTVRSLRLVLGAMTPHPFVSRVAAERLEGGQVTREAIEEVAKTILSETAAVTDARATAWYRERVAGVLVGNVLAQLL